MEVMATHRPSARTTAPTQQARPDWQYSICNGSSTVARGASSAPKHEWWVDEKKATVLTIGRLDPSWKSPVGTSISAETVCCTMRCVGRSGNRGIPILYKDIVPVVNVITSTTAVPSALAGGKIGARCRLGLRERNQHQSQCQRNGTQHAQYYVTAFHNRISS